MQGEAFDSGAVAQSGTDCAGFVQYSLQISGHRHCKYPECELPIPVLHVTQVIGLLGTRRSKFPLMIPHTVATHPWI